MGSEEEAGVYVANEESYHVSCQGCGSDRDDGDPFAISAVWYHARCVGRWSDIQCDQPFSCDGCKQAEVQSQRRATKSKNAGRPCTPRYQPPGHERLSTKSCRGLDVKAELGMLLPGSGPEVGVGTCSGSG